MLALTIWMNMPSFYQADLFKALVASGEVDLQVIFARSTTRDRQQLGWQDALDGYNYRLLGGRMVLADAMRSAWASRRRLHIVNSIWAEPAFAAALVALRLAGGRYLIYAEAPDPTVPRSPARERAKRLFGRWIARGAAGMLAVARFSADFHQRLGFDPARIYPFGYFEAGGEPAPERRRGEGRQPIDVVYIGQLVRRKGLDVLFEAMYPLLDEHPDLRLSLIGDGPDRAALQAQVEARRLRERISFEGVIPSNQVRARLSSADLLVLPSRWDGWGMVVNEALAVGVPVIVSDRCGAADVIRQGVNGYVFPSEDVPGLRASLSEFLRRADEWPRLRAEAARTGRALSSEAAAEYLIACLRHMTGAAQSKPAPPWF
jgi:glycosyltransferase involved in cell wall biosynthesis